MRQSRQNKKLNIKIENEILGLADKQEDRQGLRIRCKELKKSKD